MPKTDTNHTTSTMIYDEDKHYVSVTTTVLNVKVLIVVVLLRAECVKKR